MQKFSLRRDSNPQISRFVGGRLIHWATKTSFSKKQDASAPANETGEANVCLALEIKYRPPRIYEKNVAALASDGNPSHTLNNNLFTDSWQIFRAKKTLGIPRGKLLLT